MSASYKVFGINEFAARFPSAIASFLLVLSVFFFVRHFRGEKDAFYAAISLVLSIYFLAYSRAAVTDMAMTLFITISIFSFFLSLNKKKYYIYGFYLFSALACLTKGLIGIIFPFCIAAIYILTAEGLSGIKKIFSLKGIILFLIIAAPWYIAEYIINGEDFIQQFFIKHHFKRYTGVISGHKGPVYYFIPVLIIGLFPWIAFLPAGIRNVFTEKGRLNSFAFIWFASVFIFFSLSTTKLPNYLLSAIPAASILIASGMTVQNKKWWQYSNLLMAIISVLIGVIFLISKSYLSKIGIPDTNWTLLITAIIVGIAILSFYSIFAKKELYGFICVLVVAFLFLFIAKGVPIANQYLQGTLYKYSLYAKERLHDDEKIITYRINNPSIVFYSGHKIINVRDKDELITFMKKNNHAIAITKTMDVEVLKESGFNLLEKNEKYATLERK
jgi:predicted membrane-bound mannosyltransferase